MKVALIWVARKNIYVNSIINEELMTIQKRWIIPVRNKCSHAARLYNTEFNPPARFISAFLTKNPEEKNNSLFAYSLVLLKRLPDKSSKIEFVDSLKML